MPGGALNLMVSRGLKLYCLKKNKERGASRETRLGYDSCGNLPRSVRSQGSKSERGKRRISHHRSWGGGGGGGVLHGLGATKGRRINRGGHTLMNGET